MPHNFLPVCRQGVRRNQGDYLAKTDSDQWTDVWKPTERTAKSALFSKTSIRTLPSGSKPYFAVSVSQLSSSKGSSKARGLVNLFTHVHFEVLTLNRGVRFQRVEDFEHVGSHYIKRIIIEPDLEALSPFLLLTQAYQVATQQRMTLPVFRIGLNAGARVCTASSNR